MGKSTCATALTNCVAVTCQRSRLAAPQHGRLFARVLALALILSALRPVIPCGSSMGCSGHGECGSVDLGTCLCEDAYNVSGFPDCSMRRCPNGTAWVDVASAANTAHASAECSNMGVCNRATGSCTCAEGFGGLACEVLLCPNTCSGRGRCMSMREAATQRDDVSLLNDPTTYSLWDADKIFGCVCDEGFTGYDCSLYTCPRGFNSLRTDGVTEKQVINCQCSNGCDAGSSFVMEFKGELFTVYHSDTAAALDALLESLDHISAAVITMTGGGATSVCSTAGTSTLVEFTHDPGDQPPLRVSQNNLASSGGTVTLTVSSGTTAATYGGDGARDATTVSAECANRGICDATTGLCACAALTAASGGAYVSSNGAGAAGNRGDCGHPQSVPLSCPFAEVDSVNIMCAGSASTASGSCDPTTTFECTCNAGFTGWDCSLYTCPYGLAWFDEATGVDTAHASAECSNMGTCDRSSGVCTCRLGFAGSACERLACPGEVGGNACGGHGTCYSMQHLALLAETNGDSDPKSYTGIWDFNKVHGCHCDKGYYHGPYTGDLSDYVNYDCSQLTCPRGDNPQTLGQTNEVQTLTCDATSGTLVLTFRQMATASVDFDATAYEVKTALESLSTIDKVGVTYSDGTALCTSGGSNTATVAFTGNTGNLPTISASTALLGGGAARIDVLEASPGTTEHIECSGQGVCDRVTGTCKCFNQFVSSDGSGDGISGGPKGDCGALNVHAAYDFNVFA